MTRTSKQRAPAAPKHLAAAGRRYWRSIVAVYELRDNEGETLRFACEGLDVAAQARAELKAHGSRTFTTQTGDIRPHPCVAAENAARASFARLVALLKLPDENNRPVAGVGRPGRRFA